MIKKKLQEVIELFRSFSRQEKLFFLGALGVGFCITFDYAIIRPVCSSVFIAAYGAKMYPYVWLISVPVNFLLVSLYNKLWQRLGIVRTLIATAVSGMLVNTFCASQLNQISWLPFAFYVWKDVFVMLMFQQLWSLINATTSLNKAKLSYSFLYLAGGLGGVAGSFLPAFFAVQAGSTSLLYATLPLYTILVLIFLKLMRQWRQIEHRQMPEEAQEEWSLGAIESVWRSPQLRFIGLLVLFMQTSATLVDYQFNRIIEIEIPDTDLRTEFFGKIVGLYNVATVVLQSCGTFFIIHFLGVRRSHLLIPTLLCTSACSFLLFPIAPMVAGLQVMIKAFDFSLFGVIKEMLYIPLKWEYKFRPKAIIDVFLYRGSKAIASLAILALQFVVAESLIWTISWASVALFFLWIGAIVYMFRRHEILPAQ